MGRFLKNLLDGASSVLVLYPRQGYVRPRLGFRRDKAALSSDIRRVGRDLRTQTLKHGQQVYDR